MKKRRKPRPAKMFTDRWLKALNPAKPEPDAKPGWREMYWDAGLPSFGVRVTDRGSATFIVMRRVDHKLLRRTIGSAWRVPLKRGAELPFELGKVRAEARLALHDMEAGVDPKAKREEQRREAMRLRENNFAVVADAFIAQHVKKLRSNANVTSAFRRVLIPRFGDQPIAQILRTDVIRLVREIAADRPYAAYQVLAYCRKLFGWAIAQDIYGLEASPCDRISAEDLIGPRTSRQRVLDDRELIEIWRASSKLAPPFGPFARMLLLTGQRLREVAQAKWAEFDLDKALWTIPAERMKGDASHEVPLSQPMIALLNAMPRSQGPYVFSTTGGDRPISGFSKAKSRFDKLLNGIAGWRFHDLRRTMRTHLGGLPVPANVAELVIAHAQPGLHKVYDLHSYRDEKRRALELWADRLLSIVEPSSDKRVLRLRG